MAYTGQPQSAPRTGHRPHGQPRRRPHIFAVRVAERADKAAFATLFHHFARASRSYGLRHLGSEANAMELVQETMLLVWQKARPYHPDKAPPPPGSTQ